MMNNDNVGVIQAIYHTRLRTYYVAHLFQIISSILIMHTSYRVAISLFLLDHHPLMLLNNYRTAVVQNDIIYHHYCAL